MEFPEVFPAVAHAFFRGPPAEEIWVRRWFGVEDELAPPVDPPDGVVPMWDIFDGGTYGYRGTVQLPEGFVPFAGDSTRLAGVQRDALGVEALRVMRVSFGEPPPS